MMSCAEGSKIPFDNCSPTIAAVIAKLTTQDQSETTLSLTELDSHANMAVLGSNSYMFKSTGRTCNVKPFDSSLGTASNIPIVDGAIAYECPYSSKTYVLIV